MDSKYEGNTHEKLADNGFTLYDFFFPDLIINALETGKNSFGWSDVGVSQERFYQGQYAGVPRWNAYIGHEGFVGWSSNGWIDGWLTEPRFLCRRLNSNCKWPFSRVH
jgi:hypothetical protein